MSGVELDQLADLRNRLADFSARRDWSRFHTVKNLAMALGGECGELLAEVQWLSDQEIQDELTGDGRLRTGLSGEVADVLIYLLLLCEVAGIDPVEAAHNKISLNESRYPVEPDGVVGAD